jgi:hypothetical protein
MNMLLNLKKLFDYQIKIKDQELIYPRDFIFETAGWSLKYLVVDIEVRDLWHTLFLDIHTLQNPDHEGKILEAEIKLDKNNLSEFYPDKHELPVSWKKEMELKQYFSWPITEIDITSLDKQEAEALLKNMATDKIKRLLSIDTQTRSFDEVIQYQIKAGDEEIGQVKDLIVNEQDWKIRYVVVDTHSWLPGSKKFLISPAWVEDINWNKNEIYVTVNREKIETCPEYNFGDEISPEFEIKLFKHFGK